MANLTTQEITRTHMTPTYTAVSGGGDSFDPDLHTFLHFKNTNASTRDITITTPGEAAPGLTIGDVTFTIPATTGDKMVGPFPPQFFTNPSTGKADITYTAAAGVTVAVLKLSSS